MAADNAKPVIKSAEDIIALVDTPDELVWVEAWQTNVRIKGLTKQQQVDIRNRAMRPNAAGEMEPDLIESQKGMWLEAVTEPKFTEEQLGPLFQKNAGAVDDVLQRVLVLSGMDQEAQKRRMATFPSGARGKV